jgi:hypothetical protein
VSRPPGWAAGGCGATHSGRPCTAEQCQAKRERIMLWIFVYFLEAFCDEFCLILCYFLHQHVRISENRKVQKYAYEKNR